MLETKSIFLASRLRLGDMSYSRKEKKLIKMSQYDTYKVRNNRGIKGNYRDII